MKPQAIPPLPKEVDHYREEVVRCARGRVRRRQGFLVAGTLALLVVIGVPLLVARLTATEPPIRQIAIASPKADTTSTVPSKSVATTSAPSPPGGDSAGINCSGGNTCLDAYTIELATKNSRLIQVPSNGILIFNLVSATDEAWSVPTVTRGLGSVLKPYFQSAGPAGDRTTDFAPTATSGTATVSVTCRGDGCPADSFNIPVKIDKWPPP